MNDPITVSALIKLLQAVEAEGKGHYHVAVEEYVLQVEQVAAVSDDEKMVTLYGRA